MSGRERDELAAVVAERGALPIPVGPEPKPVDVEDQREQAEAWEGHILGAWDGELVMERGLDSAVLKLARMVKADVAELVRLRARVAELEAERHVTNEALDNAVQTLREREQQDTVVAEFVAERAGYIVAIRNCHPDNSHDYDRWQGHAESRRQLAERLGLPVAWPPEDNASVAKSADKLTRLLEPTQALREDPHDSPLRHDYRIPHDLPEPGSTR